MTSTAPFIVGVGRSGTTLLRLMLDAHRDLAIPDETHFVPDVLALCGPRSTPQAALDVMLGAPTWPNMALDADALRRAVLALDPFSPAQAVRAFYRMYARGRGKARWGDKTPPYRSQISAIAAALPEVGFIHLIRDGRDVALSYRGLWFGPGDDLAAQAAFWAGQVSAARRAAAQAPKAIEVRYEALVSAPEATLRGVCDFLEIEFDPAMLNAHLTAGARLAEAIQVFGTGPAEVSLDAFRAIHALAHSPPDAGRIGRWRTEMTGEEVARYERVAGPMLAELGYVLAGDA